MEVVQLLFLRGAGELVQTVDVSGRQGFMLISVACVIVNLLPLLCTHAVKLISFFVSHELVCCCAGYAKLSDENIISIVSGWSSAVYFLGSYTISSSFYRIAE